MNDLAGVLSPEQEAALERKLVAYDDSTSNQIAVVLVPTLNDYPIEEYALALYRKWGIGNKKTNNGILILAAIEDRKIRIEAGYGLEGAVPDITANQIITNDIAPSFRSGDYYDGIDKATNSIMAAAAGEYTAPKNYNNRNESAQSTDGLNSRYHCSDFVHHQTQRRRRWWRIYEQKRFRTNHLSRWRIWGGGGFGGGGFGGGGGGFGGFGGGSSGGGGASEVGRLRTRFQ